jgi:hypothetical protein
MAPPPEAEPNPLIALFRRCVAVPGLGVLRGTGPVLRSVGARPARADRSEEL